MKVISIITVAASMLYLYLFITVLRTRTKSVSSWLLAGSAFALFYWTFLAYFTYNAHDVQQCRSLFLISVSGLFVFLVLQNLFIRSLYKKISLVRIIIVTAPAVILLIRNPQMDVTFSDFIMTENGWSFITALGIWNVVWKLYVSIIYGTGIIMLHQWYRQTGLNREKKQIRLLIISSSTAMVLTLGEYLFYPFLFKFWTVPLTPVLFIPWVGGYVLAIQLYQFLNITPENVTRHILESVDEMVVLVDLGGKPTYFNRRAKEFFGGTGRKINKGNLSMLMNSGWNKDSQLPVGGNVRPVKKKLVLSSTEPGTSLPTLEVEITAVQDKFDDPLGYLFIAREEKRSGSMIRKFSLSPRETEIMNGLINGLKTKTIARNLSITERTVKTHIGNIFKKTGVSNRVELVTMFLQERTE